MNTKNLLSNLLVLFFFTIHASAQNPQIIPVRTYSSYLSDWEMKAPNGQFKPAALTNGYISALTPSYFSNFPINSWISPFVFSTTTQLDPQTSPWLSNQTWAYPGEIDVDASIDGMYLYRIKFTANFPACQKPQAAKLCVDHLIGGPYVDKMWINGQYVQDITGYAPPPPCIVKYLWPLPGQLCIYLSVK